MHYVSAEAAKTEKSGNERVIRNEEMPKKEYMIKKSYIFARL